MPGTSIADNEIIPRTTRRLHSDDRTRLMRSTRKIQEVVGETPYLVDLSSGSPTASVMDAQAAAGSHRHDAKRLRRRHRDADRDAADDAARPLLYIHVPDPAPGDTSTPPTRAPSPTLTVVLNLDERRYGVKDESARRRTMAKLVRTLGEHVPPALVFPPESPAAERRARRLTMRTVRSDRESVAGGHGHRARRRSSAARPQGRVDPISHGWVWVGRPEEIPAGVRVRMRRPWPESGAPFDRAIVGADDYPRQAPQYSMPPRTALHGVQRTEEEWTGEWVGAGQNMDDVLWQLRNLRVK
ncbi:hypothetical protein GGX14DRAFT_632743 [Mycena pura]|uniref:Uncharacterized protein n=1 Tax=Mycena pura TaxID=153505 RepID=A0AAD6YAQ5_9AGAR|nr:hypothetical protein GGX14DRAFT_632743 [Mycena pura]